MPWRPASRKLGAQVDAHFPSFPISFAVLLTLAGLLPLVDLQYSEILALALSSARFQENQK